MSVPYNPMNNADVTRAAQRPVNVVDATTNMMKPRNDRNGRLTRTKKTEANVWKRVRGGHQGQQHETHGSYRISFESEFHEFCSRSDNVFLKLSENICDGLHGDFELWPEFFFVV